MGFIKAFAGALSGSFADQWKDFYAPMTMTDSFGVTPAVHIDQNVGRGENYKGSANVITNGSRIIVPEGIGLMTFENGAVTGLISQPGGYIYHSAEDNPDAKSIFASDGIFASTLRQSWARFKFGGMPGNQQMAFYFNLKEIPDNKFGTQGPIYWDDSYIGAQVGAIARGSYTLRIVDPILFVKNFLPAEYVSRNDLSFDFRQQDSPINEQLFHEVVSSFGAALSKYVNDDDKDHRITHIQSDYVGLGASMRSVVEQDFHWQETRGIYIDKLNIVAIEYDDNTKALLADVQKADALQGGRGASFMQQSVARGMQGAGENGGDGAIGMAMMGMGMNAATNMAQGFTNQAPVTAAASIQPEPEEPSIPSPSEPIEETEKNNNKENTPQCPTTDFEALEAQLIKYKELVSKELISEEDYNGVKRQLLGISN